MGTWKIKWLVNHCFNKQVYYKNKEVLTNPSIFYMALLLKLFPGIWSKPLKFRPKHGGSFLIPDFISCYIYWELFIVNVYGFKEPSEREMSILDIGANIGLAMINFKIFYPNAEIICFEPYKVNYQLLKETIINNNFKNVSAYEKGMFSEKGYMKLYVNPKNSGGHSLFKIGPFGETVDVDIITLEEALSYTKYGICDLLKLDCEGAEYEIIKAITPPIASKVKRILYEATTDRYDPAELNDHLKSLGYSVEFVQGYVYEATNENI